MILSYIVAMAAVVFLSRYLFIEPKLPLKLHPVLLRILSYSSPAVLTALWAPIVFVQDKKIDVSLDNPYFISAIIAVILAWKTGNVILTTVFSMVCFFLLKVWLP